MNRNNVNGILRLPDMNEYSYDFKQLLRQHLNQILRIRKTVRPENLSKIYIPAHLVNNNIQLMYRRCPWNREHNIKYVLYK